MARENGESTTSRGSYWIRFNYDECIVCGAQGSYKEKVYDQPKPDNADDIFVIRVCCCNHHDVTIPPWGDTNSKEGKDPND